jgi:hypothetical protein
MDKILIFRQMFKDFIDSYDELSLVECYGRSGDRITILSKFGVPQLFVYIDVVGKRYHFDDSCNFASFKYDKVNEMFQFVTKLLNIRNYKPATYLIDFNTRCVVCSNNYNVTNNTIRIKGTNKECIVCYENMSEIICPSCQAIHTCFDCVKKLQV